VRLDAPKGAPDDLTLISGITAASQRSLNELGIYHFWQVAGWTPEHVAWLSSRVDGPGRIARENWMSQAARLSDKF
jgi:predicted flap endonuclease-1-like 5' DNA nuclease